MAFELTDCEIHGDDMPVCAEHPCAGCQQLFDHETSYYRWRDCQYDVRKLCGDCENEGYFLNLDGQIEREPE